MSETEPPPPRRTWSRALIPIIAVALGGVLMVLFAWRLPPFDTGEQSTDNAYVRGYVTIISPKLDGYVTQVLVRDFMAVKAGQPLVMIDESTYRQAVDQAQAELAAQKASLADSEQQQRRGEANVSLVGAQERSARAALAKAQADYNRAAPLVRQGWLAPTELDRLRLAVQQAEAAVAQSLAQGKVAQEDLTSVGVGRAGLEANVERAQAALRLAEINLANTRIVAPTDGHVGEVGVRVGQYVAPGTQLMGLVSQDVWIIANFKETQVEGMRVGEPARIRIDALPGVTFRGHVERMGPATGSEFAVIRPDNATGNFTKVVQRLPIRIVLEPGQAQAERLRPGMSVVVSINTRRRGS
ncbi:HlyD family secretion protein [Phenylobacterium koreense]|uniref:Multidrug resistance efflux pump n=1 Tax=Phenylobacterium koreense TaxID=266125 RepID=A0ABV2EJ07_9CAUL